MTRILVSIFAIGLCFAVGQTLKCFECKLGFWNMCYTTEINCTDGQMCFSGAGEAAKFMDIKTKGCLKVDECNKTTSTSISDNGTLYSLTKTCCNQDLCNAAPDLPRMSALALATLTTAFMTKVLV